MTGRSRAWCALLGAAIVVGAGTGCGPSARSCASWVAFESSAEMAASADLVVVTDAIARDGSARLMGINANAYAITVEDVEKGDADVGSVLRVASTPDSCATDVYAGGDQLDTTDPVRVYLVHDEDAGILRTLTPFAGVELLG